MTETESIRKTHPKQHTPNLSPSSTNSTFIQRHKSSLRQFSSDHKTATTSQERRFISSSRFDEGSICLRPAQLWVLTCGCGDWPAAPSARTYRWRRTERRPDRRSAARCPPSCTPTLRDTHQTEFLSHKSCKKNAQLFQPNRTNFQNLFWPPKT